MAHTTDIQTRDRFRHRGLTGEMDQDTVVQVFEITPTGKLRIEIKRYATNDPDRLLARDWGYIRYAEALLLIEQGIWVHIEEPT